ncbi:MAG: universal stress protein [Vicinamibacteraceae bacterium]
MHPNDLSLPSSSAELPSRTIRTIVFATDFSQTSDKAQGYAVELANCLGATLHALHVVDPPLGHAWNIETPSLSLGVVVEGWVKDAEARLREAVLPGLDGLVDVRLAVTVGRPATEIIRYATQRGADLLVIGTNRSNGRWSTVLASVARHILHAAPCPVLTCAHGSAHEMAEVAPTGESAAGSR